MRGRVVHSGGAMMFVRLIACALVVMVVGCAKPEKAERPVFEAFDFDYLTKIKAAGLVIPF